MKNAEPHLESWTTSTSRRFMVERFDDEPMNGHTRTLPSMQLVVQHMFAFFLWINIPALVFYAVLVEQIISHSTTTPTSNLPSVVCKYLEIFPYGCICPKQGFFLAARM